MHCSMKICIILRLGMVDVQVISLQLLLTWIINCTVQQQARASGLSDQGVAIIQRPTLECQRLLRGHIGSDVAEIVTII